MIRTYRYQTHRWDKDKLTNEHFLLNKGVIRSNMIRDLLSDVNLETPRTMILSERMMTMDEIEYYEVTMNLLDGDNR